MLGRSVRHRDQERAGDGAETLDGPSQTLPTLYKHLQ